MANPTILPIHEPDLSVSGYGGWNVTVYNNEVNTYAEVMMILMAATGCTIDEASIETWEIDHLGKSVVHVGKAPECQAVAAVISTIGICVAVLEE